METGHPSTRVVNSGSRNRALVCPDRMHRSETNEAGESRGNWLTRLEHVCVCVYYQYHYHCCHHLIELLSQRVCIIDVDIAGVHNRHNVSAG